MDAADASRIRRLRDRGAYLRIVAERLSQQNARRTMLDMAQMFEDAAVGVERRALRTMREQHQATAPKQERRQQAKGNIPSDPWRG